MLLLIVLWLVWCGLHSLLISATVSRWLAERGGAWKALHRLGYVLFSLVTLLPVLWYSHTLPPHLVVEPSSWLRVLQGLLLLYSLVMAIGGLRVYDGRTFVGIRQWQQYRQGQPNDPPSFCRTGILAYVRHPWYSGGLALLWGLPGLTDVSLVTRIILSLYLVVGTLLEERKLKSTFGQPYQDYCRTVPMLLPWKLGQGAGTAG